MRKHLLITAAALVASLFAGGADAARPEVTAAISK